MPVKTVWIINTGLCACDPTAFHRPRQLDVLHQGNKAETKNWITVEMLLGVANKHESIYFFVLLCLRHSILHQQYPLSIMQLFIIVITCSTQSELAASLCYLQWVISYQICITHNKILDLDTCVNFPVLCTIFAHDASMITHKTIFIVRWIDFQRAMFQFRLPVSKFCYALHTTRHGTYRVIISV